MSLDKDTTLVASLVESLLASISEITECVVCIESEQEKFFEIGCYLYRASPAIMELRTTEHTPENAVDVLLSLSKSINLAKDLVDKCWEGSHPISDAEAKNILKQLEGVINNMGDCLSLIPSFTFIGQKYAEVAVQSLSKEMKNAHFGVSQNQVSQTKELAPLIFSAVELPKEESPKTESDLYPVSVEVSLEYPQFLNTPQTAALLKSKSHNSQMKNRSRSSSFPSLLEYIEPLYEAFYCPLTKEIMDDPVTIDSGVTYERKAITEWFEKFKNSEIIVCPTTGKKLMNRVLSTNIALKTIIEEWKGKNEVARIKIARAALSPASSANMVLEAIKDLQSICQKKRYNRVQVRNAGVLPLLVSILEYKDGIIRCAALELLRQLVEDDDDGKEMIVKTLNISTIIKMLSSSLEPMKHASLLFLLELSKSQSLCEKIGSITGGILMLITIKYNHQSIDNYAAETADEILRNLEKTPTNIKCMAENGFFEPLLNHLNKGSEETQTEMASYLGEIVVGHDCQSYVAEQASLVLLKMVHSGNTLTRRAAFNALAQISSYHPNSKILVEAGIVQIMAEEIFTRRIYSEPMNAKGEAAAILANILESGIEHERLQVNTHGHSMSSDYVIYSIVDMLNNSAPDELNINLIRILLCLTKSPKTTATIVSLVKETESSYTLIELINNPHEELGVAAIKLLIVLAPYMGHTLAERLCKTRGLPENLIQSPTKTNQITEKQAVSAKFLAKLPHQNLTLNLALLSKSTVPKILEEINLTQRSGVRTSRYASCFLEGLVGILVRFTTTLYEPQMLYLAKNYNFTSVFTELLLKTSSDEVQRLSATGLENLSTESINLSKPPKIKKSKIMKLLNLPKSLSFGSSRSKKIPVCPVHRGACSSQNTFCLFDAKAVERLLACLDHENAEVVEAALSAICTLLDENVDVDKSISMLSQANAIQHVLNAVKEHRQEGLWQKSFWMIDRFLVKGGNKSASDISQDRLLPTTLVSAFHHGDGNTKQMAEKILRHLNKMPDFSTSNYTM
ncbi:Arm domain-containing protein/U-box domain-containing protein [Cephalotus follicularis]|uniref:RING-type E3 ubiquitin transferase n=1 Tax=Cephalotus follicularis TaxID=3775 RepID=A0A1Q3ATU6_CEPFO|nr:Arm domain-containing protein/U-box domain-containing protein [Cephalotus follicularis]